MIFHLASLFCFCLDYTRTCLTYDLPWNPIQTQSSTVKPHPTGGKFLFLFHTHPPTAVLRGANQRKGGSGSSRNLFSHNLTCKSNFKNPGCNEVNTWMMVVFRCWQWYLTQSVFNVSSLSAWGKADYLYLLLGNSCLFTQMQQCWMSWFENKRKKKQKEG